MTGGKFGEKYAAVRGNSQTNWDHGRRTGGRHQPEIKNGYVLLRGRKCPVASTISLEHTILDLTDFPDAEIGDEIVIIGRQGEEEIPYTQRIKEWNRPIPEIWTAISPHLDRLYYKDGKLWAAARDQKLTEI